jgi:hypothetical protein
MTGPVQRPAPQRGRSNPPRRPQDASLVSSVATLRGQDSAMILCVSPFPRGRWGGAARDGPTGRPKTPTRSVPWPRGRGDPSSRQFEVPRVHVCMRVVVVVVVAQVGSRAMGMDGSRARGTGAEDGPPPAWCRYPVSPYMPSEFTQPLPPPPLPQRRRQRHARSPARQRVVCPRFMIDLAPSLAGRVCPVLLVARSDGGGPPR